MAKKSSTRRVHVSPGVYFKETDLLYATKSLGITTLGLAGETVKGPAFQSIPIADWREYQKYFGSTNTEHFRGSRYPKYELPYIAKEYLKQSKQLEVVRTLGLSGVNAGPAWAITATRHKCEDGYEYVQKLDEDGNPVEHAKPESAMRGKEDGLYKDSDDYYCFQIPSPVKVVEGEDNPLKSEVNYVDAYKNQNFGICYFDDDDPENVFNGLPEGLRMEFYNDYSSLFDNTAVKNAWGDGFLYCEIDDTFVVDGALDGRVAVECSYVTNEEPVESLTSVIANMGGLNEDHWCSDGAYNPNFFDYTRVNCYSYTDDSGVDHKLCYVIIPLKDCEDRWHFDRTSFTQSNVNIYQFGYGDGQVIEYIGKSGKTYVYEGKGPQTVCFEDAEDDYKNIVIAILRSRGEHKKSVPAGVDECGNTIYTHDAIDYFADNVHLEPATTLELGVDCNPGFNKNTGDFNIDTLNYGRFNIVVNGVKGCSTCGIPEKERQVYSVSLNPNDKDYIINVLGTNPEIGDRLVYVEELYDIALEQLIYAGEINAINSEIVKYPYVSIVPKHEPVVDFVTFDASNLKKRDIGSRYLYTYRESKMANNGDGIKVRVTTDNGMTWTETTGIPGHIYTVCSWYNADNKREIFYGEYRDTDGSFLEGGKRFTEYLSEYKYQRDVVKNNYILENCVEVKADDMYYVLTELYDDDGGNDMDVTPITLDFNNYKEPYRYASTPWIVSELKGNGEEINLHKLFRFHTISDGNNANDEVKVSIENIDTEALTFDVVIRSFYDSDTNPQILERYSKCGLVPGEDNYLGLKIGTMDEVYSVKSSYVTVEINEDDVTMLSVPCGFLGYPTRNYSGFGINEMNAGEALSSNVKQPYLRFNTTIIEDMKAKKQYFGLSNLIGIDTDILSYKGVEAYNDDPQGLTPCFHLDSRILNGKPEYDGNTNTWYVESEMKDVYGQFIRQTVSVDGVSGYNWVTVSKGEITDMGIEPRIGNIEDMEGTIYEDINYRKFTVCFYGGWDGWDYYRTSRSNGDEYRYNKYKGTLNMVSGKGTMFDVVKNPEIFGFDADTKAITSDYYAYLAAIRQLDNPNTVTINLFATPGIDLVNQTALVHDTLSMVEEDRGDSFYVITSPDKPFGAGDSATEMYTPDEAVDNLDDSEIDSNSAATYYPWGKYYDEENSKYIFLPPTIDVLRDMAYTDNIKYPWYASAGWNRGETVCESPRRKLKLSEEDTLYAGRINFIKSFSKEGDRIWGNKNLQKAESPMNRISTKRLVIRLKELLRTSCVGLLFDPNDNTMVNSLTSCIKAVLEPIKSGRGISAYKIEVDDSAEARDRLELPAKVYIKPIGMLEYIPIDIIVTPQGVQWD